MSRPALTRALLVALITALAVLPATALAAKPIERFHDHFTDSFADAPCGIAVNVDLEVTDNFVLYADGTFKDTSSVRQTWTNPLNASPSSSHPQDRPPARRRSSTTRPVRSPS